MSAARGQCVLSPRVSEKASHCPETLCLDSFPTSMADPEEGPVAASPVRNGCWADEVEWQEKRLSATAAKRLFRCLPGCCCHNSTAELLLCPSQGASSVESLCSTPSVTPRSLPEHLCCPCSPFSGGLRGCGSSISSDEGFRSPFQRTPPCVTPPRLSGSSDYSQPLPLDRAASTSTEADTEAEAALVEVVVRVLQDPQVNPHQGSLSLDKLRFFARKAAPEVYEA
eukprot:RCo052147